MSKAEVGAGQEELVGDEYVSPGTAQKEAICTWETYRQSMRCGKGLFQLVRNGFPWDLDGMSETQNQIKNERKQCDKFRDPMDPINYLCEVFGDFLRCLDEHAIPTECLLSAPSDRFTVHTVFQFICHIQPRTTDLLHSLECLDGSRVLDLLVFYLANRPGVYIDGVAHGTVNALFKFLNSAELNAKYQISPVVMDLVVSQGLICLPESVISHDVSFIIDRKCGSHAADLVRNFYLYYRIRFNSVLNKMHFPTNVCDKETSRKPTGDRAYTGRKDSERHFISSKLLEEFLEEHSPGTAMDTAYGYRVGNAIKKLSDRELCDPLVGLLYTFEACILLSYDPSGKARFNVLHYAHFVFAVPYTPFPDSSSLKIFYSCWNLLRQICGPNTTYFDYNYHVSVGSREIQRMMDNLTCEWQDMLIRQYIEASEHGNIWPTAYNAHRRPMFLSNGRYTTGNLTNSMSDLYSVVSRGVKEISARCTLAAGKGLKWFYHRLQYSWYTEMKLLYIVQEDLGR